MNDAYRIAHCTSVASCLRHGVLQTLYHGPVERQRCAKHPYSSETYRWVWWVDASTTIEDALENATAEVVRECSVCAAGDCE